MRKIIFFQEENGNVPILKWLDAIPEKALDKCTAKLERLAEQGNRLRRPEADYLRDGIYELRIRHRNTNYRILYFFFQRIAVVISHGIIKEKKIPILEIEKALDRKKRFERSPEKHGYKE